MVGPLSFTSPLLPDFVDVSSILERHGISVPQTVPASALGWRFIVVGRASVNPLRTHLNVRDFGFASERVRGMRDVNG